MEPLFFENTETLPLVDLNPDGKLNISGKALPEDAVKLFNPIISFIDELAVDEVQFNINLYYFNTATSKMLMQTLRHLDANRKINTIKVNWHFEEGDEDSVETAEMFEESLLRTDFRYLEYAEAA